jgi:hypothetical protein
MKPEFRSLLILSVLFLFSACCHTNNLKQYVIMDKGFHYRTTVNPEATKVDVSIDSPAPGANPVVDVIAGAGSNIFSSEASEKLNRAVNPVGIAASISMGLEKVITTYYKGRTIPTPAENPAFIVETHLKECSLHSGSSGIVLHLEAQSEITDAATGKTVWRDCEDSNVPIRRTPAGTVPIPVLGTALSVYNAVEFFKLSEKEIQDVILSAAEDIGEQLGKSLRHDYAK